MRFRALPILFLRVSARVLLSFAAAALPACSPTREEPPAPEEYRILGFTALGDTAIAVRLSAWAAPVPSGPDTGRWIRTRFLLIDRVKEELRPLDTLPGSAAPTFPFWFYACEGGRPVSVHPPGWIGPDGTCSDTAAPAIAPNLYSVAFADARATVHLLSAELQPVSYRRTDADGVEALENRSNMGLVSILERHGSRWLWRGFANDDPSGSDSAWLSDPVRVRVQGEGTRLVCGNADAQASPFACWRPDAIGGIRDILAEAAERGGPSPVTPEYRPDGGVMAYLERPARFIFVDMATGNRRIFDAGPLLSYYRP